MIGIYQMFLLETPQDTSFSPDEFTIIQDIPRKTLTETFDFRFEFYDVNNNSHTCKCYLQQKN